MATHHAAEREPRSPAETVSLNGFHRICRAGWLETAPAADERAERELVRANAHEPDPARQGHERLARRRRPTASVNSAATWENRAVATSRRGMTTRSSDRSGLLSFVIVDRNRNISRTRRFARLRRTAPPRRRDAMMPSRSRPIVLGSASTVRCCVCTLRPRSRTAAKSSRDRNRRSGPYVSDIVVEKPPRPVPGFAVLELCPDFR